MNNKPNFVISMIQSEFLSPSLRRATVKILAPTDTKNGAELCEPVTVGVIIEVLDSITLEDLNEAIVAAAVSRLSAILKCFEGRKAKDLFANSTEVDFFPSPRIM